MATQVKALTEAQIINCFNNNRDQFMQVVGSAKLSLDWTKETSLAKQIVLRDERLLQSTPESVGQAILNLGSVGLTLNPIKQHATIVARWNRKLSSYEAQLMVMYRGLIYLAGQAGVTNIVSEVVYSADDFKLQRTDEGDKYTHTIATKVPRDGMANMFEGVYVAARMPGNMALPKVEWIPKEEIYQMRDKSDGYYDKDGNVRKDSPWFVWFPEMAKKSGLKRAQKRWEEAVVDANAWNRFQTAVDIDNRLEGVIKPQEDAIVVEPEKPKLDIKQIAEIEKLAKEAWPPTEKLPNRPNQGITKICRAYKCNTLADIPAELFDEICGRIKNAAPSQPGSAS